MRTLDLASSLEVGSADDDDDDDDYSAAQQRGPSLSMLKHIMTDEQHRHHGDKKINIQNSNNDGDGDCQMMNLNRAVLTIAFQFNYVVDQMGHHHHHHHHLEEEAIKGVALSARQYLQSVLSTVQRVAMAMAPSLPSSPYHHHHQKNTTFSAATQRDEEDLLLASWICKSYKLVHISFCLSLSIYISAHACMYVCMYVYVCMCVYACMYVSLMYVCVCMHLSHVM